MNNKLYGNLIFELSHPGRKGYSLPKNRFGHYEIPSGLKREADAELPECDEMTVVRHYTNLSENNFGVDNGFYPLGSCTMKYNPGINEEIASLPDFVNLHPLHAQKQQVCAVQYAAANDCFEDVSDDLFHDLSVLCRACRMMARICSVSCIERSSRREKKETIWANDPSK